jgi:AraC-like DNA-binding protein
VEILVSSADFCALHIDCPGGPARWPADTVLPDHGMYVVRQGAFRVRSRGTVMLVDSTTALIQSAGAQVSIAHPAGADTYTRLGTSASLWSATVGDEPRVTAVHLDGRTELAYLMLLRAARAADTGFGVAEQLVRLLITAAHGWCPLPDGGTPPVVAQAREAILADDPAARSLLSLAALLGVSPYQLSRRFSASVGMSLTQYRNRVRVSRALSRLAAGERDLAGMAADLGFADQAHLTRAVKAAAGLAPGAVRAAAADPGPWPDPDLVGQESSSHLASLVRMLPSTG